MRVGIFLFLAAPVSSCDAGSSDLCCGYETREDWTSEVTIVRDGGLVVFEHVSAIIEYADGYVVEVRPPIQDASRVGFGDCSYARINKFSGHNSLLDPGALRLTLNKELSNGRTELLMRTQNSCLTE